MTSYSAIRTKIILFTGLEYILKYLFLHSNLFEFMPKIQVEVNHSIDPQVAVERIKTLLNRLKLEYKEMITEMKEDWNGPVSHFSFKIMGFQVTGLLTVEPLNVKLEGKVPVAALPFKKTIEKKIREEAVELLSSN